MQSLALGLHGRQEYPGATVPALRSGAVPVPPATVPDSRPEGGALRRVLLSPLLIALAFAAPVAGVLAWDGLATERHTAEMLLLLDDPGTRLGGARVSVLASSPSPLAAQAEIDRLRGEEVIRQAVRRAGPAVLYPSLAENRLLVLPPLAPEAQVDAAVDRFRADLALHRGSAPRVLRVAFTAETPWRAQSGLAAFVDAALPPAPPASPASLRAAPEPLADPAQEIDTLRARHGVIDLAQDARGTAERRSALLRQQDQLRQQREAALATLSSAKALLAAQPGNVLAAREVSQAANEEVRNTLLRLQIERDHMAAQYAADFPGLKELDRKIATARASLEDGKRNGPTTTREMRNPAVDLLSGRIMLAQVDADAAAGQLAEVERQLAEVRSRGAELIGVESQLRTLRGLEERPSTQRPAQSAQPAQSTVPRVLQPATVSLAVDDGWWRVAVAVAAGAVLALLVWLMQRRVVVAFAGWVGQRCLRRAGLDGDGLIEPVPLALPAGNWPRLPPSAALPPRVKDLNETSGRWT